MHCNTHFKCIANALSKCIANALSTYIDNALRMYGKWIYPAEGVLPSPSDGPDLLGAVRLDGRPVHRHGNRAEDGGDGRLRDGLFRELVVGEDGDDALSGCGRRTWSVLEENK